MSNHNAPSSGSLKTPLHALYLIHGEESLLQIEALDRLRAIAKHQGYLRERHIVEGASYDWYGLLSDAQSAGLFGDLKLLEIHVPSGKLGKSGAEIIQKLIDHNPPDTVIVMVFPKLEKAQLQSKWFQAISKKGEIIEAKTVDTNALPKWIRERLKQHGLAIENDALTLFAERVEGNLLAAKQEIDKLALLHPKNHTLNIHDAEQAVANVAKFDVFQLSSAWMNGDLSRCTRLLDGLESEGDEPILQLWALSEDIRTLIRLSAALKQGKNIASVRQELRLWGDKQHAAPKAVNRLTTERLIHALQTCAKIDRQIKGIDDGNAWADFKHLVMGLAT